MTHLQVCQIYFFFWEVVDRGIGSFAFYVFSPSPIPCWLYKKKKKMLFFFGFLFSFCITNPPGFFFFFVENTNFLI